MHVLDGGQVVVQGIGFAGAKGFAGGYGRGALAPFGEKLIKDFVGAAIEESIKLETALRTLTTDVKVVLMHYSPVTDTLRGEREYIYPFLGSSRLLEPLRRTAHRSSSTDTRTAANWKGGRPAACRCSTSRCRC